ncbi:hypothetical protein A0J48_024230 [Sphaerospermopsis aphanizomenoides BCCUSP55]|uniref:hypothetical protein n=1 Tax=Sphaerospermopsis aphanizomenoides TaxID=459663 RepID=UPI0019068A9B|nr:hypothetical protein [Sphaerospermopsis aphanizomenoides]MBK1990593.1 hypothetical protein [Sphaerospermopsis aphanizomenoides BCCUSP55]
MNCTDGYFHGTLRLNLLVFHQTTANLPTELNLNRVKIHFLRFSHTYHPADKQVQNILKLVVSYFHLWYYFGHTHQQ